LKYQQKHSSDSNKNGCVDVVSLDVPLVMLVIKVKYHNQTLYITKLNSCHMKNVKGILPQALPMVTPTPRE